MRIYLSTKAVFAVVASLGVVVISQFQMRAGKARTDGQARANPARFSFKGLHLYMTPEEAAPAMDLINRELSPESARAYRTNPKLSRETAPCLQEKVEQAREHLYQPGRSCVVAMRWNSADRSLNPDFRFNLTADSAEVGHRFR